MNFADKLSFITRLIGAFWGPDRSSYYNDNLYDLCDNFLSDKIALKSTENARLAFSVFRTNGESSLW